MAVEERQQTAREYWPRQQRTSLILFGTSILVSGIISYGILVVLNLVAFGDLVGFLVAIAIALTFGTLNGLVLLTSLKPLQILSDAITYLSGERSTSKPPHPNDEKILNSGLKPFMEVLYAQSTNSSSNEEKSDTSETNDLVNTISDASVGVAALDEEGTVLYHNAAVPVKDEPGGKQTLKLEFYSDQTIQGWLADTKERSVRADRSWSRIPSGPAGETEHAIYDINVSYRKGSKLPVLVFLFDRTTAYKPEESDLNFIAFAAHELRGPITVIRGYLDTLIDEVGGSIDAEQRELFDRLVVSANRLAGYINNILNSARYDQRHLQLNLRETRAIDIYATIADDMALRASSQHRLLHVDIPADLPAVAADTASVSEVFSNLIDNAIKYSNEGSTVTVTAEVKESAVEVSVADNGIGMPSNVVANLFHKFYRSHRSRETVAGTGIGLYISKAIVESHGGTMQVRSVEGEGSTFSFTLPTYASVAEKLAQTGGDNATLIKNHSGGWIKNHGEIRG